MLRRAAPAIARACTGSSRSLLENQAVRVSDAGARRHMGFWSEFTKRIKQQAEGNKEFQETMEKLQKDEAYKKSLEAAQRAREAAEKAALEGAEKMQVAAKDYGGKARTAAEELKERYEDVKEDLADKPFVGKAGQAASKAKDTASKAAGTVFGKAWVAGEEVTSKAARSKAAKKIVDLLKDEEPPGPTRVEGVPLDIETTTVMLRPESVWERRWKRLAENTILGPLIRGSSELRTATGEAVSSAGDRVLGETETSITMGEIKKLDPTFNMDRFIRGLREDMIPKVLTAFLTGDLETLRPLCMERSFTMLSHVIKERTRKGEIMDSKILDLGDIDVDVRIPVRPREVGSDESAARMSRCSYNTSHRLSLQLVAARLVDDNPVLILSFSAQQINCVRNKKGEVIDGAEDSIHMIYYAWAMQIDTDSADDTWKLSEMHIQGSVAQIA